MNSKVVPTFECRIYVGLTEGYDGRQHAISEVEDVCQAYCDDVSLCVTISPTTFVYKRGREHGAVVGLINYPRFPTTPEDLKVKACDLAGRLQAHLGQNRVSVVCSDKTVMFEVDDPTVQKSV